MFAACSANGSGLISSCVSSLYVDYSGGLVVNASTKVTFVSLEANRVAGFTNAGSNGAELSGRGVGRICRSDHNLL